MPCFSSEWKIGTVQPLPLMREKLEKKRVTLVNKGYIWSLSLLIIAMEIALHHGIQQQNQRVPDELNRLVCQQDGVFLGTVKYLSLHLLAQFVHTRPKAKQDTIVKKITHP